MALLLSDYVALLIVAAISVLLCFGVRSDRRIVRITAYSLATLVFCLHLSDLWLDYLWVRLLPHPSVVVVHLAAVWGPIIAILIGLSGHLPRPRDRRALMIIAVLVGCYGVYVVGRQLVPPGEDGDSLWIDGVLLQSTGTTCIAAAAASYLNTMGIRIDESEAVRLGVISPNGGTNINAWRILRLKLPDGYHARIGRVTKEEMIDSGEWYITSTHLWLTEGHEIVIRARYDGRSVEILDPLRGRSEQDWDRFADSWLKTCVWAEKRPDVLRASTD